MPNSKFVIKQQTTFFYITFYSTLFYSTSFTQLLRHNAIILVGTSDDAVQLNVSKWRIIDFHSPARIFSGIQMYPITDSALECVIAQDSQKLI